MIKAGETILIDGNPVVPEKLLGKGKSGYSWLANSDTGPVVLKALHDEPNPYYRFDRNKYDLEIEAYQALCDMGLTVPALIGRDPERSLLLKAYVPGDVAGYAIAGGRINDNILRQLVDMFRIARTHGRNLDYFPMNFVIAPDERLFYIDYEINPFSVEWDLWNWGIYYWLNTTGMARFLESGDPVHINIRADSGVPIKTGLEERAQQLKNRFDNEMDR